ncbi:MAG: hypothetical protein JO129_00120 [Candidatus Dependentiae bacterium]|nr:hypothetical protein [Candidatus Dependentiae bacterium]
MYKKTNLILSIFILFNSFQIQGNALGIALFASTALISRTVTMQNIKQKEAFALDNQRTQKVFEQIKEDQKKLADKLIEKNRKINQSAAHNQSTAHQHNAIRQESTNQKENSAIHQLLIDRQTRTEHSQDALNRFNISNDLRNYRSKALEELESVKNLEDINSRKDFFKKYIVPPMETHDNEIEIFFGRTSQKESAKIYVERVYTPKNSDTTKIIYMPVIHGTFSKNAQGFGKNIEHPISEEIICQANQIALEQNATVKLFVIEWNGKLDENARKDAGKGIAEILKTRVAQENPDANISIQPIAHSYGCDVARHMILNSPDLKFDTAFFLASPQTNRNVSDQIKIVHIYGDHDAIATGETWWSISNHTSTDLHDPHAHVNIRLKDNGDDLNHKSIKNAIRYLPEIPKLLQKYPGEKALIVNAFKEEPKIDTDDDYYLATEELSSPTRFHVDGFVDESKCNPQEKNIARHKEVETKFKQTYGIQDPYTKPTFAQAVESECKSAGVTGGFKGIVRNAIVSAIGGIENFINSDSASLTKTPSPISVSKTPSASDLQEKEEEEEEI